MSATEAGRDAVAPPVGSLTWAEVVLRAQQMPQEELHVVLTTADDELIRRHLELHLERLEETLVTQRRRLAAVKRMLIGTALAT